MSNGDIFLPDLELDTGPLTELRGLYPVPELRASWPQSVDQQGGLLDAALASVDQSLLVHRARAESLASGLSGPALRLDEADIAITQAKLETQINDLQAVETQAGAMDAEIDKLEQLDPTQHNLSPQTLSWPELDALDRTYAAALAEWEAAYPLWPLSPPG